MTERIKKLNRLLSRRTKIYFIFLILLMFAGAVLEMIGIGAIPVFLATMSDPEVILTWPVAGTLLRSFDITEPDTIFLSCAAALVVIYLTKNAYLGGVHYFKARFAQKLRVSLSKRLFTNYMSAPYAFHLNRNSSELLRNTCVEIRILCLEVLYPLLEIMLSITMVIAITILLLVVEPYVSLILFATLGAACVMFIRVMRDRLERYGKEEQEYRKKEYQAVNEGLGGFKDARMSGTESYFIHNFVHHSSKTAVSHLFKQVANKLSKPVMEFLAVFGMILLAVLLRNMGREVMAIIPTLGLFGIAILKLQVYLTQLASEFTMFKYNMYTIDPVYDDIMELEGTLDEQIHIERGERLVLRDRIKLNGICYTYPESEKEVLHDIDLEVEKGQAVGLVGATGSGKTTLIHIILGLLQPTQGTVTVDGENMGNSLRQWQQSVGYIPQNIYLADQSVRRNIAFGHPEEEIDDERVRRAITIAQLDGVIESLDRGVETIVGENGIRLSGGQRQRLGIARAVYHEPEVLVMDEGTSSLDNQTEASVMSAIRSAGRGKTKIMIAHRLSTVKNCDRIFFLKDGRLQNTGTYSQLIEESEEFRAMAMEGKF